MPQPIQIDRSVCDDWPGGLPIATGVWEPYVFNCSMNSTQLLPGVECPKPGLDSESLGLVLRALGCNFTVKPYYGEDVPWGNIVNGRIPDGLYGEVFNETIATLGTRLMIASEVRSHYFNFR
jgi:hypothetical protein